MLTCGILYDLKYFKNMFPLKLHLLLNIYSYYDVTLPTISIQLTCTQICISPLHWLKQKNPHRCLHTSTSNVVFYIIVFTSQLQHKHNEVITKRSQTFNGQALRSVATPKILNIFIVVCVFYWYIYCRNIKINLYIMNFKYEEI